MDRRKSLELRTELGTLCQQMRAIVDKAETEKRANSYTSEESAELKRINARCDELETKEIPAAEATEQLTDREARLAGRRGSEGTRLEVRDKAAADEEYRTSQAELVKRFPQLESRATQMPGLGAQVAALRDHARTGALGAVAQLRASPAYAVAYRKWLNGRGLTTDERDTLSGGKMEARGQEGFEQRDLSVGIASQGGYAVPLEMFLAEMIQPLDNEAVIRTIARTFTVAQAQSLGAPSRNEDIQDTVWTSELAIGTRDASLAIGKREMHPWPLAQYEVVSKKLLRASPLSFETFVRDRLLYKTAVAQSKAFNTGTGASQPLGLYTADNSGIDTSRDVSISSGGVTDPDLLITARFSLRQPYWPKARWHMHRLVLSNFRAMKASATYALNYLWQPGLTVGAPGTLLDFPYYLDEYAPSTLTGGGTYYLATLGDFDQYWIVDAIDTVELDRLEELFALTNQVAYVIRMETDAQPVLADAFVRVSATLT